MVIIEAGLIVNGMPKIQSIYYQEDYKIDSIVKSNLVAALQTMAENAFDDEAKEMRLKKYIILIKDIKVESVSQLFLYAIAEIAGTDIGEVRKRLENLGNSLDFSDLILDLPILTKDLEKVQKKIDKALKDLSLKPEDRARYIFG
ncbi:MAG: hypothetical protein FK731_06190 [Asgard group archaeon]|nr:hypothetical protein [Asgard group archaeon]